MRKLHILTLILKLNAHTYLQTYKILRTSHRSYLDLSKFKSKMNQNIYIPTIFYLISFSFKSKYLNLYDWWGIIIQLRLQISFGLIIKRNSNDKNWIVFQAGNDPWLEKKERNYFERMLIDTNSIESIWLGRLLLMIFVLGNHQPIAVLLKMILIVFIVDLLSAQNWPFFIRRRWFIMKKESFLLVLALGLLGP